VSGDAGTMVSGHNQRKESVVLGAWAKAARVGMGEGRHIYVPPSPHNRKWALQIGLENRL
jgi:hypothetical protein